MAFALTCRGSAARPRISHETATLLPVFTKGEYMQYARSLLLEMQCSCKHHGSMPPQPHAQWERLTLRRDITRLRFLETTEINVPHVPSLTSTTCCLSVGICCKGGIGPSVLARQCKA